MLRAGQRIAIPNPHGSAIGRQLLREVLKQAGLTRDEWERL